MRKLTILLVLISCSFTRAGTTVIGNNGQPPTTTGHVPFHIPGVTLDASGNIYTVHDWDEPHFDIIRWNTATGRPAWNSGHIIGDMIDCIAVEPDGSVAYVTAWNTAQSGPPWKISLWKCTLTGTAHVVNFTAGTSIVLTTTSTNPHIPLALSGQNLWLTNQTANQVVQIDKTSGSQVSSFAVTNPFGIAIDSAGNLWVGTGTGVSVYSTSGALLGTPITSLSDVDSLSIGGSTLFVVARGQSTIKKYTISGVTATYVRDYGRAAHVGEAGGAAVFSLNSVATNASGNLVWCDYIYPSGDGSRLHSEIPYDWNALDTESGPVAYSPTTKFLIGSFRESYSVDSTGTKEQAWKGSGSTDYGYYFGKIARADFGTRRVLTLGGNDFLYFFTQNGNLAIYRVVPSTTSGWGPALQFASCLAFGTPGPDGSMVQWYQQPWEWSWNDTTGPGLTSVGPSTNLQNDPGTTINWTPSNPGGWAISSANVDDNGTLWICSLTRQLPGQPSDQTSSVWAIPLHGINAAGNPIYLWTDAVKVVSNTALCNAMGLPPGTKDANPQSANLSVKDGQLYIMAENPNGVSRGGAWMAGNVLIAFPITGFNPVTTPAWVINGANYFVGLCPLPVSGFITGQNTNPINGGGAVKRYDINGNLIATYVPDSTFGSGGVDNPCGAFDSYGAVNASLNPNGSLDIFTEDDFNSRAFWFNLPN